MVTFKILISNYQWADQFLWEVKEIYSETSLMKKVLLWFVVLGQCSSPMPVRREATEGLQYQLLKSALFISRILKIPNCKSISENSAVIKNCLLVKEHYQSQVEEKNSRLVKNQESQKHLETYPHSTTSLNGIKPSVSFNSIQETKMHGLEVKEGSAVCEDRPATVSTKEYRRRLWNTACKTINPAQTVQSLSLTWSLSSPKNNNHHIREHNKY